MNYKFPIINSLDQVRAAVSQTKVNGIRHFIGGISWLASSTNSAIMDEN